MSLPGTNVNNGLDNSCEITQILRGHYLKKEKS
jgi:hypothetical protein